MIPFVKREDANTARKLPLFSDGDSKYHLMIVSTHSDQFKMRKNAVLREAALSATDGKLDDKRTIELTAKLAASTITDWLMPEEFGEYSKESAEKLLLDYPQICDAVDAFSSKDGNYLEKKSKA